MDKRKLSNLGLMVTLISFLGFCVENVWLCVTKGYMNNRNMLLPFLYGYGLAVVAIYLMFGTPKEPKLLSHKLLLRHKASRVISYFLIACTCVAVGEIILGTVVEKVCGFVWWDYSSLPMNITRYTSVPTTLMFGALITLFMQFFISPINDLFCKLDIRVSYAMSVIFMTLMTADFIHSAIRMLIMGDTMRIWKISF